MSLTEIDKPTTFDNTPVGSTMSKRNLRRGKKLLSGMLPKRPSDFLDQQAFKRQKFNFSPMTLDFLTPSPPTSHLSLYGRPADLHVPMTQLPPPKPTLSPCRDSPFSDMPFQSLNRLNAEVNRPTSLTKRIMPPCVDLMLDDEKVVKSFTPKNLTKPKTPRSLAKPKTPRNLAKPKTQRNLTKPKIARNLTKPKTTRNLTKPKTTRNLTKPKASRNVTKPTSKPDNKSPLKVAKTKKPKKTPHSPVALVEIPPTLNYNLEEFKPKQLFGTWGGFGGDMFTIDKKLGVSGTVKTQIKKTKTGYTCVIFKEVWKINEQSSTLETIEWENTNPKATMTKVAWTKIPGKEVLIMNDLVGNWAGYGDDRFNVQTNAGGALVVRYYELEKEIKANVKLSRRRGKTLLNAFGSCWVMLSVVSSENEVYWLRKDYKEGTGTKYACWRRLILKK